LCAGQSRNDFKTLRIISEGLSIVYKALSITFRKIVKKKIGCISKKNKIVNEWSFKGELDEDKKIIFKIG